MHRQESKGSIRNATSPLGHGQLVYGPIYIAGHGQPETMGKKKTHSQLHPKQDCNGSHIKFLPNEPFFGAIIGQKKGFYYPRQLKASWQRLFELLLLDRDFSVVTYLSVLSNDLDVKLSQEVERTKGETKTLFLCQV